MCDLNLYSFHRKKHQTSPCSDVCEERGKGLKMVVVQHPKIQSDFLFPKSVSFSNTGHVLEVMEFPLASICG